MGLIKYSKHAPLKKKFIKGNQAPFMNRKLEKEIGIRSKLRNNCWRELLAILKKRGGRLNKLSVTKQYRNEKRF